MGIRWTNHSLWSLHLGISREAQPGNEHVGSSASQQVKLDKGNGYHERKGKLEAELWETIMEQWDCQQSKSRPCSACLRSSTTQRIDMEAGRKPGDAVGGSSSVSSWGRVMGQGSGHPNMCQKQANGLPKAEAKLWSDWGKREASHCPHESTLSLWSDPPTFP